MDDMVKRLNISKGNVSVHINILKSWGAVRKVWVKGSRKNYYTADPDIWKIVSNRLKAGLGQRLDRATVAMDNIKKDLTNINSKFTSEEKQKIAFCKQRLNKVFELKDKLAEIVKTFSAFNM